MRQDIKERIEQIQKGIVPEGYKKTKIGIIPEDWEIERLKVLGEFFRGKGVPKSEIISNGLPAITYGQLYTKYHDVIEHINTFISKKIANKSFEIQKGDILFASSGETAEEIGKSAIYLDEKSAYAGGDILVFRPFEKIRNKVYGYLLNTEPIRYQKYKFGEGHSVVHIYQEQIQDLIVPVIKKAEQQRIASILETWDRAIELKEKLIQEKQTQKKGLMEKLITHFPRNINIYYMKDIFKERKETGFDNYELLAVTTKDGVIKRSELDRKDTSSSDKGKYKLVCPGDIAYNTMRMWQGVSGLSNYKGIVSPAYTVLTPNKTMVDPLYLSYLFKTPFAINIFKRFSQGLVKDTLSLKYTNFKSIRLRFPNLNEQQRIAEILSTADREIELLKEEVELLKQQKKGLMQLLLTGIIRV